MPLSRLLFAFLLFISIAYVFLICWWILGTDCVFLYFRVLVMLIMLSFLHGRGALFLVLITIVANCSEISPLLINSVMFTIISILLKFSLVIYIVNNIVLYFLWTSLLCRNTVTFAKMFYRFILGFLTIYSVVQGFWWFFVYVLLILMC